MNQSKFLWKGNFHVILICIINDLRYKWQTMMIFEDLETNFMEMVQFEHLISRLSIVYGIIIYKMPMSGL